MLTHYRAIDLNYRIRPSADTSSQKVDLMLQLKSAQEQGQAISCEFDHIRFKDPQKVHTYINGIYRKLSNKGFFLISAFYISTES